MARPRASTIEVSTPQRLLDAAELEFGRVGFDAARLADIAKAVGISRPSLLHHFPSKEALYEAVVLRVFGRLATLIATSTEGDGEFIERLDAACAAFIEFIERHRGVAPLLLREILDGRGPGQELLLREGVPLLDSFETFVREVGGELVSRPELVRPVTLQFVSDALVRTAAGPLRQPLWGETDWSRVFALALFDRAPE